MNAIEFAFKTEEDAIGFYQKAAGKTSHPVGRKMFLSIVEDEKGHLEAVRGIIEDLDIKLKDVSPLAEIRTVFARNKDSMLERLPATADDLEALRMAMKMERESADLYRRLIAEAKTPKEKALFAQILKQEEEHYFIFSNTFSFLSDSGNWFMWHEHSAVDGGTPWA